MNDKRCPSCGYVGDDFGRDSSQIDGRNRYCRPCVRAKSKLSVRSQAAMVKAWHASPEYVYGTTPTDEWRVENGFRPAGQRGPRPLSQDEQRELAALAQKTAYNAGRQITQAEWSAMRASVMNPEPLSEEDQEVVDGLVGMFSGGHAPAEAFEDPFAD